MATITEIRKIGKSRGQHYLWFIWVIRPISYYVAWLFIKLGISANQTTVSGGILGITGCVLLVFGSYQMTIIGMFLIVLYGLFDCVDGNIARVTGTASNYGRFLDVITDYTICSLIPLSVSFGLYGKTGLWLYLVIGGLYTFSRFLSVVISLAYDVTFHNKVQTIIDNRLVKWGTRIILLEMPIFIVCAVLNRLESFLGLFALLFVGKTITVAFIILIRERGKSI